MNTIIKDVLLELDKTDFNSQRDLSNSTNYSVGTINKALKQLLDEGYINSDKSLTNISKKLINKNRPQKAIILAAGVGTRMIPINYDYSKGMITVNNETLVERIIKQLHEIGVEDIYIVVGFMKEQYEYLIDEYGVHLVVNEDYKTKNNMHSLNKVIKHINNAYIVPCDIYCKNNPFRKKELYSWYMICENKDINSNVRVNRNHELVRIDKNGNRMVGIAYVASNDSKQLKKCISNAINTSNENMFWEEGTFINDKMIFSARIAEERDVVEIDTYEQLRDLDYNSPQLSSDIIDTIVSTLDVSKKKIDNIKPMKKGMTNRSFTFECNNKKYIMRIPGEGTAMLINRSKEASVYRAIANTGFSDNVIYINPDNGYKITEYIDNLKECNANDNNDLVKCMDLLRKMHSMSLKVNHRFELFERIDYYESLRNKDSVYPDYDRTKKNILSLKKFVENHKEKETLTHIDAVSDNFLFSNKNKKNEKIYLIDWEYASMQDPHVDIAMFGIYSLYDRKQMDNLINIYFENECPFETRMKIYCYVAICGLLWSNWCEYKSCLGIEFGEYSLRQYRYAKEYYRIFKEEYLEKVDE